MNSDSSELRHHQEEQTRLRNEKDTKELEFATVEEMLRYDASQNPAPPRLQERVEESLTTEPKPARSWWRRLFRRGNE